MVESAPTSAVAAATDEPILTKPEEPAAATDAKAAKLDEAAAEPKQEMGLSESTLHWLVDGEQAIEPVANEPGTQPHSSDPRAPVAGPQKRTRCRCHRRRSDCWHWWWRWCCMVRRPAIAPPAMRRRQTWSLPPC